MCQTYSSDLVLFGSTFRAFSNSSATAFQGRCGGKRLLSLVAV